MLFLLFLLDYLFHEKMQYKNPISMNPARLTVLIFSAWIQKKKEINLQTE